jgi:hypothetical protein
MNIPQITYANNATSSSWKTPAANPQSPSSWYNRKRAQATPVTMLAYKAERTVKESPPKDYPPRDSTKVTDKQKEKATNESFCPYHGTKSHSLLDCKIFREIEYEQRKEFLVKNRLCFNCASSNKHIAKECDQGPPKCAICERRHNTVLHDPNNINNFTAKTFSACTRVCGNHSVIRSCAKIVLLKVSHQSEPSTETLTYAVLDDQSTDVFITDTLLDKLRIDSHELNLRVNTITGTNTIRTKRIQSLQIQDIDRKYPSIKVPYAYTRETIPATPYEIATPEVAQQWPHLRKIADKVQNRPDTEVGMLIGRNVPTAFQQLFMVRQNSHGPKSISSVGQL